MFLRSDSPSPSQWFRRGTLSLLLGCVAFRLIAQDPTVLVETLKRLKGSDLEARPAIKQAVVRVLEQVRGTPSFVELVRDFQLNDQNTGLIQFAREHPNDPAAAEALRTALSLGGAEELHRSVADPKLAVPLVSVLATAGDPAGIPILAGILASPSHPLSVRTVAVQGMSRLQPGAEAIIALAREKKLPVDLHTIASQELHSARWPEIKSAAALVLPKSPAPEGKSMPPVSELLKMTGDIQRGAAVFRRPDVNCIGCHQVQGEGVNFGPALSEIGSKLGKDAIYESIINPSNGISFGFESWQLMLKDGDEAFGLIASESEDEVSLKLQGGSVQKIAKKDIARREKQAQSIMPADLQANLKPQEFVDLVEYLASLRK